MERQQGEKLGLVWTIHYLGVPGTHDSVGVGAGGTEAIEFSAVINHNWGLALSGLNTRLGNRMVHSPLNGSEGSGSSSKLIQHFYLINKCFQ